MSEILSQEEIDKLLNAYSSGELDADEYKKKKMSMSKFMILNGLQSSRRNT